MSRTRSTRVIPLILLSSGFWVTDLAGQCDAPGTLSHLQRLGCLSQQEAELLSRHLRRPLAEKEERTLLLRTVARAYTCLLESKLPSQDYSCFREILHEQFYTGFQKEELCLNDRLIRAGAGLRYFVQKDVPGQRPLDYHGLLDEPLGEFLLALDVCRKIQERPADPASLRLAETWCVDPAAPAPPLVYLRELIDAVVEIAARYPQVGKHAGALLDGILQRASTLYRDRQSGDFLHDQYDLLIGFDDADLAGTSLFYLFERRSKEVLPPPELASPADLPRLLENVRLLDEYLERGAQRLVRRSRAWEYFERYSDRLQALADLLKPYPEHGETRHQLVQASCRALRKGIELSFDVLTASELVRVQEKLLDRIRTYGLELARNLKYRELTGFEGEFVDESGRMLTEKQQCFIHAHLAQAYYVLGSTRDSLQHLRQSCNLISPSDLKELRESVQRWTNE